MSHTRAHACPLKTNKNQPDNFPRGLRKAPATPRYPPTNPAPKAAALAAEASAQGVALRVDGDDGLRWATKVQPSGDLLARLRAAKPELIALLHGEVCRHCDEPVAWSGSDAVAFADGTSAHLSCYERAETQP